MAAATKHLGAKLTRAGAMARRIAVVATRCAGCGSIGIYAGPTLIGTVNLAYKSTARKTLFLLPAFSLRTATITIRVLSSGKTVEIDGLGISRT